MTLPSCSCPRPCIQSRWATCLYKRRWCSSNHKPQGRSCRHLWGCSPLAPGIKTGLTSAPHLQKVFKSTRTEGARGNENAYPERKCISCIKRCVRERRGGGRPHHFHISYSSDYISHYRAICITRSMKAKQTTPLKKRNIIASYCIMSSAGGNCTAYCTITGCSHSYSICHLLQTESFEGSKL